LEDIKRSRVHYRRDNNGQVIQKHPFNYCCREKFGLVTTMFRRELMERNGKFKEVKWGADDEYVRRMFKSVIGIKLQKIDLNTGRKVRMMNYLNDNRYIPDVFYCVEKVLYLSYEMTEQNLTSQRKKVSLNITKKDKN